MHRIETFIYMIHEHVCHVTRWCIFPATGIPEAVAADHQRCLQREVLDEQDQVPGADDQEIEKESFGCRYVCVCVH